MFNCDLLLQYNHACLQQLNRIDQELVGKESSWKNVLIIKTGSPAIHVLNMVFICVKSACTAPIRPSIANSASHVRYGIRKKTINQMIYFLKE